MSVCEDYYEVTEEIYGEICRLTEYEEGSATAEDLYNVLVKVQNEWEFVTACCDD